MPPTPRPQAALESIPDSYVEKLSPQSADMWMQGVIGPQAPSIASHSVA